MHNRSPVKLLVTLVLAVLCAVGAYAQFQTGNIYGKVQAKDGSALPGVTVTLTGVLELPCVMLTVAAEKPIVKSGCGGSG